MHQDDMFRAVNDHFSSAEHSATSPDIRSVGNRMPRIPAASVNLNSVGIQANMPVYAAAKITNLSHRPLFQTSQIHKYQGHFLFPS